jgi:hypothetical protein
MVGRVLLQAPASLLLVRILSGIDSYLVASHRCSLRSPLARPSGRAGVATDLLLPVIIFLQRYDATQYQTYTRLTRSWARPRSSPPSSSCAAPHPVPRALVAWIAIARAPATSPDEHAHRESLRPMLKPTEKIGQSIPRSRASGGRSAVNAIDSGATKRGSGKLAAPCVISRRIYDAAIAPIQVPQLRPNAGGMVTPWN